ncbi:MAG: hypothetical protein C4584_02015 [Armatimonadetes bacterium]|nr:MAG: hypothetical protein C4584_02015 [Armatimonadota bacterium]
MAAVELEANLALLEKPNVGRLVIGGTSGDGNWQLITGMGGRSTGSKNRFYLKLEDLSGHGEIIRTSVHDMTKQTGDASMTLYTAHRQMRGYHVAGNGEQVDGICIASAVKDPFIHAFTDAQRLYTTEGPTADYTSRISAAVREGSHYMLMGRVEKNPECHAKSIYRRWVLGTVELPLKQGEVYLLTTYNGEGGTEPNYNPPMKIPLRGTLEENMDLIWEVWDKNTRAGLCGKEIIRGSNRFTYSFRSIHSGRA